MKRNLTLIVILLGAISATAVPLNNEESKKIIEQINVVYLSWNVSNSSFYPSADYITDSQGQIIGKRYYAYKQTKYWTIDISDIANNKVKIGTYDAVIKLQDSKLAFIKGEFLHNFEFNVVTNEKGLVTGATYAPNSSVKYKSIKMEYHPDGKIAQILYGDGKSVTIQKTFGYSGQTVVSARTMYKVGKWPNPKAIEDSYKSIYEQAGDSFIEDNSILGKRTLTYNNKDVLVGSINEKGTRKEEQKYVYTDDGKLFKEEKSKFEDGALKETWIRINFTRTDLPESLPAYERIGGIYNLDSNGELVREQIDNRYREKIGGVWSEWKYMRM